MILEELTRYVCTPRGSLRQRHSLAQKKPRSILEAFGVVFYLRKCRNNLIVSPLQQRFLNFKRETMFLNCKLSREHMTCTAQKVLVTL